MSILIEDKQTGLRMAVFSGCQVRILLHHEDEPVMGEVVEAGETFVDPGEDGADFVTTVLSPVVHQREESLDYLVVQVPMLSPLPRPLPQAVRVEIAMNEDAYMEKLRGLLPNPADFQGRSADMNLGGVVWRPGMEGEEMLLFL